MTKHTKNHLAQLQCQLSPQSHSQRLFVDNSSSVSTTRLDRPQYPAGDDCPNTRQHGRFSTF
jgi:hypothetical protein